MTAVAAGAALCGGGEPKYVNAAAIRSGGASSTQALTASCGQMSPSLGLVEPIGTMFNPLRSANPGPNRSDAMMAILYPADPASIKEAGGGDDPPAQRRRNADQQEVACRFRPIADSHSGALRTAFR